MDVRGTTPGIRDACACGAEVDAGVRARTTGGVDVPGAAVDARVASAGEAEASARGVAAGVGMGDGAAVGATVADAMAAGVGEGVRGGTVADTVAAGVGARDGATFGAGVADAVTAGVEARDDAAVGLGAIAVGVRNSPAVGVALACDSTVAEGTAGSSSQAR